MSRRRPEMVPLYIVIPNSMDMKTISSVLLLQEQQGWETYPLQSCIMAEFGVRNGPLPL